MLEIEGSVGMRLLASNESGRIFYLRNELESLIFIDSGNFDLICILNSALVLVYLLGEFVFYLLFFLCVVLHDLVLEFGFVLC